ncbi:hypothetical protein OG810_03555 [Streptomyces sp. NBC_01693]
MVGVVIGDAELAEHAGRVFADGAFAEEEAVIVASSSGHTVNSFMWVRAVLLPVVAVLIHRLTVSASRGSRRAFERVSALVVIMPIAIIGVDLIPGVCPPWYAVMQVVCMLPVIRVAFVIRGSALRDDFPKSL